MSLVFFVRYRISVNSSFWKGTVVNGPFRKAIVSNGHWDWMACNIIIDRKYSGIAFLEIKGNNLHWYIFMKKLFC